jgi:hypothetical protein
MKRLKLLAWLSLGLAAVVLLAWAQYRHRTRTISLPSVQSVKKITFHTDYGRPKVQRFEMPREYFGVVLGALTPCEVLSVHVPHEPPNDIVYGTLTIETDEGRTVRITLYDAGKAPVMFSVDGIDCERGGVHGPINITSGGLPDHDKEYVNESAELYNILVEIHDVPKTGADRLRHRIENLEISRGARPPRRG